MAVVYISRDPYITYSENFLGNIANRTLNEYENNLPSQKLLESQKEDFRYKPARRPFRGLQVKEETYSSLMVVSEKDGSFIPLLDESSSFIEGGVGKSGVNSNFIIQMLSTARMEKYQIIETFGEDAISFFGQHARFVDVSGTLINTADFNWVPEFLENYDKYLRGTSLLNNNCRAWLYFDERLIEGYLLQCSTDYSADPSSPYMVRFGFRMYITKETFLTIPGGVYIAPGVSINSVPLQSISPLHAYYLKRMKANTNALGDVFGFIGEARRVGLGSSLANIGNNLIDSTLDKAFENVSIGGSTGTTTKYTPRSAMRTPKYKNSDEFTSYVNDIAMSQFHVAEMGSKSMSDLGMTSQLVRDILNGKGGMSFLAAVGGTIGMSSGQINNTLNAANFAFSDDSSSGNSSPVTLSPQDTGENSIGVEDSIAIPLTVAERKRQAAMNKVEEVAANLRQPTSYNKDSQFTTLIRQ